MSNVNAHSPVLAGGIVSVDGTLVVDTGLHDILTANVDMVADAISANEESIVTWKLVDKSGDSETRKILISVFKGGTNHGTAGDSAVDVSWSAQVL